MFRSVAHIYVQAVDDATGRTLAAASTRRAGRQGEDGREACAAATSPAPKLVGQTIAERLIAKGLKQAVFDRNGFLYHGRIQAVAEAARKAGLEF